jgi:protocatechuate 3,4-dioxygenase beta subunit
MRCLRVPLAVIVLSAVTAAAAWTQTPPPQPSRPGPPAPGGPVRDTQVEKVGTAILSGRVVHAETGKPLRRALVRAFSSETPQGRTVSTDADGRWQIKALPAGNYRVNVSKGGFVDLGYGQRRPFEGGKVLDLAEGQKIEKVDVSLPRAGVITGQVLDEFGEPVTGARVAAMRYRYIGGQRRMSGMGPGDMTDDIGQFRLHGLAPGEYFVSATMMAGLFFGQSEDRVGYAPTFYPGTAVQSEAQRVTVSVGQETQQINIPLSPSRISTISGKAVSASGRPIFRGLLMLSSLGTGGSTPTMTSTSLKPDGTFLFSNITPGEYRVQVQHSPNSDDPIMSSQTATEFGSVVVTVSDRDVTNLLVVTSPGATAAGRIVFDGDVKPSFAPQAVSLGVVPLEFGMMMPGGSVRVRDDWSFEATGLSGQRRFRLNMPPSGWYLKSVTHQGTDITDGGLEFKEGGNVTGLEIVLTQRATDLSGSVQDASARPVTDYVVVAFSADSAKWGYQSRFVRSTRPNQEGRFSIKGLPADNYVVVALDYLEPGEESDPEQLEQWKAKGTRVTLADAEAKALTLKLTQ